MCSLDPSGTSFVAMLPNQSGCEVVGAAGSPDSVTSLVLA